LDTPDDEVKETERQSADDEGAGDEEGQRLDEVFKGTHRF
jgi:hypothetical protein